MRTILLIAIFLSTAGYAWSQKKGTSSNESSIVTDNGKNIYRSKCIACHGKTGTAQRIGATRLSSSVLDSVGMANIIVNGKKRMPSYGDELTNGQVEELIQYIIGLRYPQH